MDEMENGGSISAVGSNPPLGSQGNNNSNNSSVLCIKGIENDNLIEPMTEPKNLKIGLNPKLVNVAITGNSYDEIESDYRNPNQSLAYLGDGPGRNLVEVVHRQKNSKLEFNPNLVNLAIVGKNSSKVESDYRNPNRGYAYLADDGSDGDDVEEHNAGSGLRFRIPFEEKVVNPILKAKKYGQIRGEYGANRYYVSGYNEDSPPGFRAKGKMNINPNSYYGVVNLRANSSVRCEMNTNILNEVPSFGSGSGKKGVGRGVKRERGAIDEIVSTINLLGEGFVRMEKMKMDMAREMEKMRMEMELKRNKLILESQRQIVDTFVSVMLENNKNKKKEYSTTVPQNHS